MNCGSILNSDEPFESIEHFMRIFQHETPFQTKLVGLTMAPKKETKITREEELLLEGFNKNVSTKSSALFYGNAFIVSAIPVWLYWRVHSIDITSYAVIFAIGTLVSTWLLAFAYKNTKHMLKHKVALKREAAVTKEMTNKLADDKKISKKEKDERILWKKNEVSPQYVP